MDPEVNQNQESQENLIDQVNDLVDTARRANEMFGKKIPLPVGGAAAGEGAAAAVTAGSGVTAGTGAAAAGGATAAAGAAGSAAGGAGAAAGATAVAATPVGWIIVGVIVLIVVVVFLLVFINGKDKQSLLQITTSLAAIIQSKWRIYSPC